MGNYKKGWIALFAAVLAAGCNGGGDGNAQTTSGSAKPGASSLKVGMVFDSGGRGDKSFNDSAYAGLEKAEQDLGIEKPKTIDSQRATDYLTNLTALADGGCNVIFAVGLTQGDALKQVAPKYPDIKFAIVDGFVDAPNVRCLRFSEEQGSFLAGYAAALASKTHKVGFVGGEAGALIKKFEVGYTAGAKTADPNVEVLPARYTGSWDNVSLGKATAKVLFDGGADVVFHAAGRCGLGVIDAAKDAKQLAIGCDGNQDDIAPGFVLTSMIKRVDNAVHETIKDAQENKFTAGPKAYDLAGGGVGLTDFKNTKARIGGDAGMKKLEDIQKRIVSGEIKVPSTAEELAAFKAPK